MKLLKTSFTVVLLSFFVLGMLSDVEAQNKRAAVKTYNKALELAQQGKYEQSISMYNQAITQAKELGEGGQDIIERSQNKLPQVYQQLALNKFKNFQKDKSLENMDEAIEAFRQTKEVAEKYGDGQTQQRAEGIITKLLYNKSLLQYQTKNYEDAMTTLNKVIERDTTYAKAYYQKGIVTKDMNPEKLEEAISYFDKAIEVGEKTNDSQIVSRAKQSAHDNLLYRGGKSTDNENYDRAVELLNRALEYDASSDLHYRLAEAYNNTQDWQKAVNHSQEALALETGGKTEKAKIYFELANAYQGLGKKEEACNAYSNAAYGEFKSPAEHQMEYELKCESATN